MRHVSMPPMPVPFIRCRSSGALVAHRLRDRGDKSGAPRACSIESENPGRSAIELVQTQFKLRIGCGQMLAGSGDQTTGTGGDGQR